MEKGALHMAADWFTKRLYGAVLLLLLAGCHYGPPTPPPLPPPEAEPGPPAESATPPVTLTLSPGSGGPGTTVTATLHLREPEYLLRLPSWFCFGDCGDAGASTSLSFAPAKGDQTSFSATFTIPALLPQPGSAGRFDPVTAGEYTVYAACVKEHTSGCAFRPEVSTTFQITEGLSRIVRDPLPPGEAEPLPPLGTREPAARSLLTSSRLTAECVSGNFDSRMGEPPKLLLTDDAGQPLPPLIFQEDGPLFPRHGYAGCGALALDPVRTDSIYLLSAPHAGGTEEAVFPRPYFTADGGINWAPVPAPEGFDPSHTFLGFQSTVDGVTAWFLQTSFDEPTFPAARVQGSFTADGGRSWASTGPTCPADDVPCIWHLGEHQGLIYSADGGQTWSWATLGGDPFVAQQVLNQGTVLEAVEARTTRHRGAAPLLRSEDGGATWHWVDPPPPGG